MKDEKLSCRLFVTNYFLRSVECRKICYSATIRNVEAQAASHGMKCSVTSIDRRFREVKNELIDSKKYEFIEIPTKSRETYWLLLRI